jgi:protein NEDD1
LLYFSESFELIRKNKTESLSAIAACKSQNDTIRFATGYFSGIIKIRNLDKSCSVIKEFIPTKSSTATSVAFMDFNCSDENLACVNEDSSISVFGLQTMIKLNTFNLDNSSSLVRFHPSKRSQLGVISDKGTVTVMDIFSKKPSFMYKEAHASPCTDVQMTNEDLLISCSYDSKIRIFDLRKKSVGLQITANSYGWTTLSISKCGTYFVGGNVKGEIISYDIRNIKKPLKSIRVDNENLKISRIAFLESNANSPAKIDLSHAIRQSFSQIEDENVMDDDESNESYIEDIIGFQKGRISDFSSTALCHATRVSTTRLSTQSRLSENFGKNMQEALNDLSFSADNVTDSSSMKLDDSCVNKDKRRVCSKDKRRSSTAQTLHLINEELSDKENDAKLNKREIIETCANTANNSPCSSNTPSITITKSSPNELENSVTSKEVINVDEDESFKSMEKEESLIVTKKFDFQKEFHILSEKIHFEIQSLNMDQNMRHIQLMSYVSEQRRNLQDRIELIENSIAYLMNDDFKINRITELQAENEDLRLKMNKIIRSIDQSEL